MKKSLIYTFTFMALIVSASFTAIVSSLVAAEEGSSSTLISTENDLAENSSTTSLDRSENVYVITNSDGTVNKSFVNNTVNTSSEPLPIEASITYSLDSNEIKAEDLVNKSGHVKITYKFTATKSFQGKLVPFLTVTGLDLDSTKFKNIKIDHGKIISESDNILLTGYTFAGLNEDLNIDMLSDSFTIEADVTNFELPDTYTFATNELFAEIDTTKLTSIDSIINSINDLGSVFDQILAGSAELTKGSTDLATGTQKLATGANELATGANSLASGITVLDTKVNEFTPKLQQLATTLSTLSAKSTAIHQGVQGTFTGLLNTLQNVAESTTDPVTKATLNQIIASYNTSLPELYTSLGTYTGTVDQIASATASMDTTELTAGIATLKSGADDLASGANQLASGANELSNGTSQLATGANTLNSGLTAFKEQGLNKLINFANHDLSSFIANLRSTINAATSYHHYSNPQATSVKFIFKTPSLK